MHETTQDFSDNIYIENKLLLVETKINYKDLEDLNFIYNINVFLNHTC